MPAGLQRSRKILLRNSYKKFGQIEFFKSRDYVPGCPIGNFAQEMEDINPVSRKNSRPHLMQYPSSLKTFLVMSKSQDIFPNI